MPRCFALFSGGQDSALAIALMKQQGVDVIALNFVSHFFGGPSEKVEKMAKQLNVPVLFVPFHEQQLAVTVNPKHGRGKNFNACIDCHASMIRIAGLMMKRYNVDFIITGEVLGQRPMSQNAQALVKVQKLSNNGDLILRPLSAKLLPENQAYKFVNKDLLLDISGRSVTRQEALVKQYNLIVPSHGGGCPLTVPQFGDKMKQLFEDQVLTKQYQFIFVPLKNGRLIRYQPRQYIIIGRNEGENKVLQSYFQFCDHIDSVTPRINENELVGPAILILNLQSNDKQIEFNELQLNSNDIEDIQCGCTYKCSIVDTYQQEEVYLKSDESLQQFALKSYNWFCRGKGQQDCVCEANGERVLVQKVGEEFGREVQKLIIGL